MSAVYKVYWPYDISDDIDNSFDNFADNFADNLFLNPSKISNLKILFYFRLIFRSKKSLKTFEIIRKINLKINNQPFYWVIFEILLIYKEFITIWSGFLEKSNWNF